MNVPSGYTALDLVGFTDRGTYSNLTNYVKNDLVHYGGDIWKCLLDDTTNKTPAEGTYWTLWIDNNTTADSVSYNNTQSGLSATNVKGAIDEVSSDIATLSNLRAELGAHNLLDMSKAIIVNNGLSTATINSDGTVYVDGTTTGQSYFPSVPSGTRIIGTLYDLKPNTTYKLSTGIAANAKVALQVFVKSTSSSSWEVLATNTGYAELEFTIPATFYEIWARVTLLEGATFSNVTFKPMLRLADDTSTVYGEFSKPNTELTKDDSGLTANAFENGAVNLFEVTLSSGVQNEVAYVVNADKTVSVSVTQQATSQLLIGLGQFTFKAGKRYRLSGCPSGAGSTTYGLYTGGAFDKEDRGNGIELVSNVDVTTNISILIRKNCPVVNNVVFKPMITVADMPNSDYAHYVPYCKSNKELTEYVANVESYEFTPSWAGADTSQKIYVMKVGKIVTINFMLTVADKTTTPLKSAYIINEGTIPQSLRPSKALIFPVSARNAGMWNTADYYDAYIVINTNGSVGLSGKDTDLANVKYVNGAFTYIADYLS